jgi:hypothetical protein
MLTLAAHITQFRHNTTNTVDVSIPVARPMVLGLTRPRQPFKILQRRMELQSKDTNLRGTQLTDASLRLLPQMIATEMHVAAVYIKPVSPELFTSNYTFRFL